jgi:polysaccharide biosynthesis/export protein
VFQPGTFLLDQGGSKEDFIALAGQETRYADKKRTYVIKANGSVTPSRGGGMWLSGFSRKGRIEAGDTIVVPTNLDYEKPLTRISAVTAVIFQSMASVAAFFSIKNN